MDIYVGVDISKASIDAVVFLQEGKERHKVFVNRSEGFEQFQAWLAPHEPPSVHVCLEATNTYGEAVAVYLHEAGYKVSIVNPAATSAFAKSQLSRTKTDKEAAHLIALFCQRCHPPLWTPPDAAVRELQDLVRRLETLEQMRQMEANRLERQSLTERVKTSLQEHLDYLEAQMQTMREAIHAHIQQTVSLQAKEDLLISIPGIAQTTAATLLAELQDVSHFTNARQIAAFAGLAPRICRSGTSVRGRAAMSKMGSPRLRKALYFPALSALRFNPSIKALGERLNRKERVRCSSSERRCANCSISYMASLSPARNLMQPWQKPPDLQKGLTQQHSIYLYFQSSILWYNYGRISRRSV